MCNAEVVVRKMTGKWLFDMDRVRQNHEKELQAATVRTPVRFTEDSLSILGYFPLSRSRI